MSEIELTITVEQYGTNVRVTQDWTSVLDKMARDIADKLDEATLARLGYVKQRTCHEVVIDRFFRGCGECGYMWEYMYGIGKREPPKFCPSCGAKVVYA